MILGAALGILGGWDYSRSWGYVYSDHSPGGLVESLATWLLPALVTLLFWDYRQGTPGKMVMSARIVDAVTLAHPRSEQWIIRYLGYFVSALPLGLGFLWIAFDPRKQGWHDKLAQTVVVFRGMNEPARMAPEPRPPMQAPVASAQTVTIEQGNPTL